MPADWYAVWARDHCKAFGLVADAAVHAVLAWEEALVGVLGARDHELREATTRCLIDESPPRFVADHLAAVKRHLAALKAKARADAERAADGRSYCSLCGDSGVVVVPHPASVAGNGSVWEPHHDNEHGDPVRATAGVFCRCRVGVRSFEAAKARAEDRGRPQPLDLAGYEERVTNQWTRMLQEESRRQGALARAAASARGAGGVR